MLLASDLPEPYPLLINGLGDAAQVAADVATMTALYAGGVAAELAKEKQAKNEERAQRIAERKITAQFSVPQAKKPIPTLAVAGIAVGGIAIVTIGAWLLSRKK